MAIVEKKIFVNLENGTLPDVERIENAIIQQGLDPVRWAIVDITENEMVILANGIENSRPR